MTKFGGFLGQFIGDASTVPFNIWYIELTPMPLGISCQPPPPLCMYNGPHWTEYKAGCGSCLSFRHRKLSPSPLLSFPPPSQPVPSLNLPLPQHNSSTQSDIGHSPARAHLPLRFRVRYSIRCDAVVTSHLISSHLTECHDACIDRPAVSAFRDMHFVFQ